MKRLSVLVLAAVLFSCKDKDIEELQKRSENTYHPEEKVTADEPVMYTNEGEIHDQALIKDFLRRQDKATYFTLDKPTTEPVGYYSLEFQEGNNVVRGNIEGEIVEKNDKMLLIADKKAESLPAITKGTIVDSLVEMINKYGPLQECTSFYTTPCEYKKKSPVLIENGEYYIPYVVGFVTITYNRYIWGALVPYMSYGLKGSQMSVFNEALPEKIRSLKTLTYYDDVLQRELTVDRHDTLVIQTMRRHLKK